MSRVPITERPETQFLDAVATGGLPPSSEFDELLDTIDRGNGGIPDTALAKIRTDLTRVVGLMDSARRSGDVGMARSLASEFAQGLAARYPDYETPPKVETRSIPEIVSSIRRGI